jgi:hypothetical protein
MKKAPKTALCAKETKKPETFRFPVFSGAGVHNGLDKKKK